MFINFTNHPSTQWSAEQKAAALIQGLALEVADGIGKAHAQSQVAASQQ